jgi:hypothetical protein
MSYLDNAVASSTVTVATETAIVSNSANDFAGVPSNARMVIWGVIACAAGTAGTTAAVKVRQGANTITGTQVGSTITGPVQTGGLAAIVPFFVVDTAPPANGQYTATLTFTANTSSVVTGSMAVLLDSGILE